MPLSLHSRIRYRRILLTSRNDMLEPQHNWRKKYSWYLWELKPKQVEVWLLSVFFKDAYARWVGATKPNPEMKYCNAN
jgi:hypothetical protein